MNRNDQEFFVQKIRAQYTEPEHTPLCELKKLDCKVKKPASTAAWILGAVGAIILGSGMSLTMTDLGAQLGLSGSMIPGVVIGLVGLALTVVNYPIYKRILASRRRAYASRILALSDELLDGSQAVDKPEA